MSRRCVDCGTERGITATPCSCGALTCSTCRARYHSGEMRLGCANFAGKKLVEEIFGTRK